MENWERMSSRKREKESELKEKKKGTERESDIKRVSLRKKRKGLRERVISSEWVKKKERVWKNK